VKQTHPDTPFILYISGSAGVIERMARTGVDIVSLDWTVDMAEGLARLPEHVGVQGNVDPGLLFGTPEAIRARIDDTVRKARGRTDPQPGPRHPARHPGGERRRLL
jgi:uroporphyrinogen decarboxylase